MKRVYKRVSEEKYNEIFDWLTNLDESNIFHTKILHAKLLTIYGVKLMYFKGPGNTIDKYYVLKELL